MQRTQRTSDHRVDVGAVPHRGVRLRPGEPGPHSGDQQQVEQAVQHGLLAGIVLGGLRREQREGFLTDLVRSGRLAFPAGEVAEPFIDAGDVAEVAAAALTEDRHVGQVYEVTGPRLLTFTDVAAELSRAIGRPVRYQPISFDEFADGLTSAGVPADAAAGTVSVFREILDGRNAHLTGGVHRALGRPAADFAEYARAAAATGVWRS